MKQVEVSILGQAYMLGCPEGGDALLAASVAAVDREMTTIRESGKVRARERIAVLAALNMAYQLAEHAAAVGVSHSTSGPLAVSRHNASATDAADAVQLDALVARIDEALRVDGQLL